MQTTVLLIFFGVFIVIFIFIMRIVGSWMLRIDDVIKELKAIRAELTKKD